MCVNDKSIYSCFEIENVDIKYLGNYFDNKYNGGKHIEKLQIKYETYECM